MKPSFSALFIGRFQPVHLGHADALKQIFAKEQRVLIGIGSAENNFTPDNPFTAGERFEMLHAVLAEMNISAEHYAILPARNIENYALWVSHLETLFPPFGRVYTGSEIVKDLFLAHGKHEVHGIARNLDISATRTRTLLLENGEWEKFVPPAVHTLLRQWHAAERMKEISQ